MKENKKVGWKVYVGSGLVIVGSTVAGLGFWKEGYKNCMFRNFHYEFRRITSNR